MLETEYSDIRRNVALSYWIDKAVRGLYHVEAEQLRKEFLQHYEAAMEDLLASGKSAEEAHEEALGALGNAKRLNRSLRQTHLTILDHIWLGRLVGPHRINFAITMLMLYIVGQFIFCLLVNPTWAYMALSIVFFTTTITAVYLRHAHPVINRKYGMAAVMNAWLCEWFLGCIAMIILQPLQSRQYGIEVSAGNIVFCSIIFWSIVFLIQAYRYSILRRKLEAPCVKGKL